MSGRQSRVSGWTIPVILATALCALASGCAGGAEAPAEPPEHAGAKGAVTLSEDAVRAAGIQTALVSREAFHPYLAAAGVIRPDPMKSVVLKAPVAGKVLEVTAEVAGRVRSGESLATLEGPEVSAIVARARSSAARAATARRAVERAEELVGLKAMSGAELDSRRGEAEAAEAEAEAARQDLARLGLPDATAPTGAGAAAAFPIRAPLAGVILDRRVVPGQLVEKDAPLFTVADLSRVWAVADVYEKDLGRLREEGMAEVRSEAYPGEVFTGKVALVEPALDEASRTAHVRIVLDNRDGRLRPGLFVTVAIPLPGAAQSGVTAVPEDALQTIAGLPVVFVEIGAGRYEARPVETGRAAHGMAEVRNGLREGEKVVTRGAFVLKSELMKGSIEGEDH